MKERAPLIALPLFVIAVVAALAITGSAVATFPGSNGRIVFAAGKDGKFEIYSMNSDGTDTAQLANSSGGDADPTWSPDGARIAFVRVGTSNGNDVGDIFVMNSDGTGLQQVTSDFDPVRQVGDQFPAWSPDGLSLVFVRNGNLFTISAQGGSETQITHAPDTGLPVYAQPSWGAHGILATRATWGIDVTSRIVLMQSDGTQEVSLTDDSDRQHDANPDWSPDGTRILFAHGSGIDVMQGDGSGVTALTSPTTYSDFQPRFSPDGSKIVFGSDRDHPYMGDEIYVMNADGTGATRLTTPVRQQFFFVNNWLPSWGATPGAANHAPVCSDGTFTTSQGSALQSSVTCTDADGDPLAYAVVSNPTHGAVTLGAGGTFTYTPDAGYSGSDSFTFKANDGRADSNVAAVSITVTPANIPPTASIAVSQHGDQVSFDGSASSDPDDAIVSYAWDLGDGRVAGGARTKIHVYAPGTYVVTLTVTDARGATGTAATRVTILRNFPPTAAFTAPTTVVTGDTVSFDASSSSDVDDAIVSYSWDFGDGGRASGIAPSHAYQSVGSYIVTLTVTDARGATGTATETVTVSPPSADLAVSVSAPATALANVPFVATFTVTNNGPSTAHQVELHPGVRPVSAGSSPFTPPPTLTFTYSPTAQCTPQRRGPPADCVVTLGDLASGQSATVTVTAESTDATLEFAGEVRSAGPIDPNRANDSASADTIVGATADIGLAARVDQQLVTVGDRVKATFTLTNSGPDSANGIVVDVGVSAQGRIVPGPGLKYTAGRGSYLLSSLDPGSSKAFTVVAEALAPGPLIFSGQVTGQSPGDPNPQNNGATATSNVVSVLPDEADLSVTASASPTAVTVGKRTMFTFDVRNAGPRAASGVVLDVPLPQVGLAPVLSAGCHRQMLEIECGLGTMSRGAGRAVTISLKPKLEGTLSLEASVDAISPDDPDPSNNSAFADVAVGAAPPPSADVSVGLYLRVGNRPVFQPRVIAGTQIALELSVVNAGSDPATGVTATLTVPVGSTVATMPSRCTTVDADTLSCNIGQLGIGVTSFAFALIPGSSGTIAAQVTDVAPTDPDLSNNSVSRSIEVVALSDTADLTVSVSGPGQMPASPNVLRPTFSDYTLTVTNNGPALAPDVLLTDVIDNRGLTLAKTGGAVSVAFFGPAPPSCTTVQSGKGKQLTSHLVCDLGALSSGSSATVVVPEAAVGQGEFFNAAEVSEALSPTATLDPVSTNDSASLRTVVDPADLTLTQTASSSEIKAGEDVTFTLRLTNNGPAATPGKVVVTDMLTGDFQNAHFVQPALGCSIGVAVAIVGVGTSPVPRLEQGVTCKLASLPSGKTFTVSFVVEGGFDDDSIDSSAAVSGVGTSADPTLDDEEASVSVDVAEPPRSP